MSNLIHVPKRRVSSGAAGLSLVGVGYVNGSDVSSTVTVPTLYESGYSGDTATMSEGDTCIILVKYYEEDTDDLTITGYTKETVGPFGDPDKYNSTCTLFWKVQGATPDTSVTRSRTFGTYVAMQYIFFVVSGADTTTLMDVASVASQFDRDSAGAQPNPAAITPTTAGAWVLSLGGDATPGNTGVMTEGYAGGAGNMTELWSWQDDDIFGGSEGSEVAFAYYTDWTSGSFDPAAFSGFTQENNNHGIQASMVLRPAT